MKKTTKVEDEVKEFSPRISSLKKEISRVIVGQEDLVEKFLACIFAGGHVLLEGVPGLAKTLLGKTLASSMSLSFSRVQFTPDLLPADITGTLIFDPKGTRFITKKGPVFANFLLADEINRAPAKVQSALLEAMQEMQVTIGEKTYPLESPFFVVATQNPIEQEGTYPLPEAQVDRFMAKLLVGYPSKEEELQILERMGGKKTPSAKPVITKEEILKAQELVRSVHVDRRIAGYIVDIVSATRHPEKYGIKIKEYIMYGASPRGSLYLYLAAKARAFLQGRSYVIPDDVKWMAKDVLRHRIILSYEAEAEEVTQDQLIATVLSSVKVP